MTRTWIVVFEKEPGKTYQAAVQGGSWQIAVKRAGDLYATHFHTRIPPRILRVQPEAVVV